MAGLSCHDGIGTDTSGREPRRTMVCAAGRGGETKDKAEPRAGVPLATARKSYYVTDVTRRGRNAARHPLWH